MKKNLLTLLLTASVSASIAIGAYHLLSEKNIFIADGTDSSLVHYASNPSKLSTQPIDFSPAAESGVKSVVHIKTLTQGKTVVSNQDDPFSMFFGPRQYRIPDQVGSGSGVIISQDGYIVTNNHVIQGADKVQITFDDRKTKIAEVIGTDPSTDLAVLKIEGENDLPYITLGNSDEVKLGQWVLAIGYPLNLDATVTAGIVSAKSRSIGINRRNSNTAIESFIQTDAAVNPGNSGGALINTNGELVGINSAIASPTGTYAGYSYAIPSNLVMKVTKDIIQFGSVKRGFIGAQLLDLNKLDEEALKQLNLDPSVLKRSGGVYVMEVTKDGGAQIAGINKGDIITAINATPVSNLSQLTEIIARFHPGDKVSLSYNRGNNTYNTSVELKSDKLFGEVNKDKLIALGAEFRNLNSNEIKDMGLNGGIIVENIDNNGMLSEQTNIQKGFIITSLNDQAVTNVKEFQTLIQSYAVLQLGGVYKGKNGMFYYGLKSR